MAEELVQEKIARMLDIIDEDADTDGDYWIHCGNKLLETIFTEFSTSDWKDLIEDLATWEDHQLSIFTRAIHGFYSVNIDTDWLFGYIFVILNDLEDCECLIQDLYIILTRKEYDLELLIKIRDKIIFIKKQDREAYKNYFGSSEVLVTELIEEMQQKSKNQSD